MWAIDVPDPNRIGEKFNIDYFSTKEEAIAWIRKNIGPCDNDGCISLISEIDEIECGCESDDSWLDDDEYYKYEPDCYNCDDWGCEDCLFAFFEDDEINPPEEKV